MYVHVDAESMIFGCGTRLNDVTLITEGENDPVAFTAYASRTRDFVLGSIVTFDDVITNVGGHYTTTNSTFVCPRDGIYVFAVSIMSGYERFMYAELRVNDVSTFTVFADEAGGYSAASKSAVVECSAGQRVLVRSPSSTSGQMYSDPDFRYSTFSGFLLVADSNDNSPSK